MRQYGPQELTSFLIPQVFKVETVADSYVACAGVPSKRRDHAVVMARFANDCMNALVPTVMTLERSLGPGTGDIRMRFGLHSGPVTAGVLRGERARFQLFGTTINTASRIESTGKIGMIHASEQTADLLMRCGKKDWVRRREDKVTAKGLGELTTYWIDVNATSKTTIDTPGISRENASVSGSSSTDSDHGEKMAIWGDSMVPRDAGRRRGEEGVKERLVSWNVVLLSGLLQRILASRASSDQKKQAQGGIASTGNKAKGMVADEVCEIIELPDFTGCKTQELDSSVEVPAKAKEQLHALISAIADGYYNNPFHNWDHASHVAMSVQKLLSRIVAPSMEMSGSDDAIASALHDHTYGITSDSLTQFAVVL